MTKIIDHRYTIQEAFQQCFYIVPDYQREYVWTEKQVSQLLQDIDEQMDDGASREYFVGTILVSPTEENNHFEVIDGQQRLTTFFLLLCALRQRFRNEPDRSLFDNLLATSYANAKGEMRTDLKLEPRYEHAGDLMRKIVEAGTDPTATRTRIAAAGIPDFGSLEKLMDAYDIVCKTLEDNYGDAAKLRRYWGYLGNNVVFIQISTDLSSALKIFETINERGVGLDSMDLLKNLLFTSVKPGEFSQLKDEWKKITAPLERAGEKPLRFLRYFLMANYKIKNKRGDAVVREDEIYDWFTNNENAALCDYKTKPLEFVRKIIRDVNQYLAFIGGRGKEGKQSQAMGSLQQLCGGAFSLHYVLLLAARNLPDALFEHFVTQIESFLFYYIFTKTPTKELERNFSSWADELRDIAEVTDAADQKRRLNMFIADRFQTSMAGKDAELTDTLRRYTLRSMQQYRTKYLLAKLTQHVDMAFKGMRTPGALSECNSLEIEPNTPDVDLRTSFAADNPGKGYDDYKIKLGNLTLLEKPINIVASNDFFRKKKVEYRKSANYLTRSIVELTTVGQNSSINRFNTKLIAFDNWGAADIDRRQDMLINLAKDVWRTVEID